jgi:spore coat assembly protein
MYKDIIIKIIGILFIIKKKVYFDNFGVGKLRGLDALEILFMRGRLYMQEIEIGSRVTRKSYGGDILFSVDNIIDQEGEKVYILKGVNVRLQADSAFDDLELSTEQQKNNDDLHENIYNQQNS